MGEKYECKDPFGNEFNSIAEMLKEYKISSATYYRKKNLIGQWMK